MPRSRKNKQRRQAQRETQCLQDAQATAAAEEESTPSFSPQCEGIFCPRCGEVSHYLGNEAGASEAQPSTESSEEDNLPKVALLLEQFLLYKYKMKQPIMKEDMLQIVGEYYEYRFPEILKIASEHIEAIFALDLKKVDTSSNSYELISQLKLLNNGRVHAGRGFPKTGLLMNILGLIFIKGNRAAEEDVWKFLNLMHIYAGRKHYIYGEPRKLFTKDLVRLQYLVYRQVPGSDPVRHEFLWGPKAHAEINKMKILEYLVKVSDIIPSTFSSCYEQALQELEERAGAIVARRAATTG